MSQRLESTFVVPKMDCPSEEQRIRMALEPLDEANFFARLWDWVLMFIASLFAA